MNLSYITYLRGSFYVLYVPIEVLYILFEALESGFGPHEGYSEPFAGQGMSVLQSVAVGVVP